MEINTFTLSSITFHFTVSILISIPVSFKIMMLIIVNRTVVMIMMMIVLVIIVFIDWGLVAGTIFHLLYGFCGLEERRRESELNKKKILYKWLDWWAIACIG